MKKLALVTVLLLAACGGSGAEQRPVVPAAETQVQAEQVANPMAAQLRSEGTGTPVETIQVPADQVPGAVSQKKVTQPAPAPPKAPAAKPTVTRKAESKPAALAVKSTPLPEAPPEFSSTDSTAPAGMGTVASEDSRGGFGTAGSTGSSGSWEQTPSQRGASEIVVPPSPPRGARSAPADVAADFSEPIRPEPSSPNARPLRKVVVPEGTAIEVRLAESISTEKNQSGDRFEAILDRDLEVGGSVVVKQGARVWGRIKEAIEPGKVKGLASITFTLEQIEVEGEGLPVEVSDVTIEAESTKGRDVKAVGAAAAVGTALGAIFGGKKGAAIGGAAGAGAGSAGVLLSKGSHAEISAERLFSFRLEKEVELTLR